MNNIKKYILITAACISCNTQPNWWDNFIDVFAQGAAQNTHHESSSHHSNTRFNEHQASEYIDQLVRALDFALKPHMKNKKIKKLCNDLKHQILNDRSVYFWTQYGKRYKKEMIDQFMNGALLDFVEQRAYRYAIKKSQSADIARRVSESMRNNALARIQRHSSLDFEWITEFVGKALKRAVRDALNKIDAPYNTSYSYNYDSNDYTSSYNSSKDDNWTYNPNYNPNYAPQPSAPSWNDVYSDSNSIYNQPTYDFDVYPSDDCCCCFESFDDVQRIFLKPCGHDMCKDCAKEWFVSKSKTCPHCRTKPDWNYLQSSLR